jgi:hypothetical protein
MSFRIRIPSTGGWILHQIAEGPGHGRKPHGRGRSGWPLAHRPGAGPGEDLAPALGLGVASALSLLIWTGGLLLLRQFGV